LPTLLEKCTAIFLILFLFRSSEDAAQDFVIIREIYENNSSEECFENELEGALEAKVKVIVIEPSKLGDETARWIYVGNCLHKTAVLAGVGCLITGLNWPDCGLIHMSFGFTSVICAGVYAISWQFDPCCKYQIESNSERIKERLSYVQNLNSSSPVVLVRRDDTRRKLLHNVLALSSIGFTSWKIYEWYFK